MLRIFKGPIGRFSRRMAVSFLFAMAGAAQAQLTISSVTDTPDPVSAGGTVTYTVGISETNGLPVTGGAFSFGVPANGVYVGPGSWPPGVSCTGMAANDAGPGTLSCTGLNLAANQTALTSFLVRSTVSGAALTVTATVAGGSQSQSTTVNDGADLSLAITGPATVAAGSQATFNIVVTNSGPNQSPSSTVSYPLPSGFVVTTPPAGCSIANSTLTCSIGNLVPGNSRPFSVQGVIGVGNGSSITHSASVVAGGGVGDGVSTNNSGSLNTSVTPGSAVSVTKTKSVSDPVLTGTDFDFRLDARYSGDYPAGVQLSDPLPANFCVVGPTNFTSGAWSCTASSSCPAAGGTVSCTRTGTGAAGYNQTLGMVTIPVRALTPVVGANNTATVSAPGVSPANGTVATTVSDPISDLRANKTKTWPQAAIPVNQVFDYRLSTTNLGPIAFPASGTITLTDNLPAGLQVNSITPPAGFTCVPSGALPLAGPASITCTSTNVALAVNATTSVITVNAQATTTGATLTNSMCVSSANGPIDNNAPNNCVGVGITPQPPAQQADIRTLKRVVGLGDSATNRQLAGQPVSWEIEIVNAGPDVATGVAVTDVFNNVFNSVPADYSVAVAPGAATFPSCGLATGASNVSLSGCTITSLPVCTPGTDCPRVQVSVRHFGSGTSGSNDFEQTNTAFALSQTVADSNLSNNTSSVATAYFLARTDVAVTKTDNQDPIPAGQKLTYVIAARNLDATSASDAFNVTATDTLPSGLVFLSASSTGGGSCSVPAVGSVTGPANNTLSCTWTRINRGSQQTITVEVRPLVALSVAGGGSGSISNTVVVSTTTPEIAGGAANNTATEPTAITGPVYDLLINNTDDIDPLNVDENVTYTLTVTNNGASAAENVVLTDTLSSVPGSPTFVEVVGPLPPGVSCNTSGVTVGVAGGSISCTIALLGGTGANATGEPASVSVRVRLRGVAKGTYTNNASVAFANSTFNNGTFDPQGNNAAAEPTLFRLRGDVQVVGKRAVQSGGTTPVTNVAIGQVFDWLVDVRNNGPHAAETTTFSDTLPTNMLIAGAPVFTVTAGSFTPAAPICSGAVGGSAVSCAITSMPVNGTATVRIPVQIAAATATTYTNTASIVTTGSIDTNGGTNPTGGNNFGSGSVTLQTSPGLSGQVYVDSNKDGVLTAGEPPIAGVTLTLTGTNASGTPVSVTTVTAADGTYQFLGLPPSNAAGYTITETQPATYVDAQETVGRVDGVTNGTVGPDRITNIVYPGGVAATGVGYNFGEVGGSLAGLVFNDVNRNGVKEQNDLPIAGVTITLTGNDANGQPVSRTTTTGPDGRYRFADLPLSDATGYTVTETQPADYDTVGERPGTAGGTVPAPNRINVRLTAANPDVTGYDFYEKTNRPASLSGTVWRDGDHDRSRAPDEPVLAGWTVELLGCPNGAATCAQSELTVVDTKTTGSDGGYRFEELMAGNYQVRFRSPSGQVIGGVWPTDPVQNASGGPNPSVPNADSRAFIPVTLAAGTSVVNQDLPLDPSGVVYDSVSAQPVPGARVTLTGPAGFDPAVHLLGGTGSVTTEADGTYHFFLLPGAPAGDYGLEVVPPGGYELSGTFPPTNGPLNLQSCASPAGRIDSNGTDPCVVTPPSQPVPAGSTTVYFMRFSVPGGGGQRLVNNHIPLDREGSGQQIELRKTSSKLYAKKAELVPYTITARNTRPVIARNVTLVDTLPPGFKYVEGSLKIQTLPSGPALPVAISLVGRQFTIPGQNFAANETKKLTMVLGVGVGVGEGEYVNQVLARQGPNGPVISNVATAAIRVVPDALFDCTDVIGKVYDDKNANGYQDEGEPGLAGVRLATVNGLLVTTDAEGRYHIDCAAIPKEGTGSNFVLKLDERTLPSGYRVTSENPAAERMTRGKLVKINFGATVHRVVRLDLQATAFEGVQLKPEFAKQLDRVVTALAEKPSVLRLAYRPAADEDPGLTKQRIAAVKEEVLRRWKAYGRASDKALFNLDIEVELAAASVKP